MVCYRLGDEKGEFEMEEQKRKQRLLGLILKDWFVEILHILGTDLSLIIYVAICSDVFFCL